MQNKMIKQSTLAFLLASTSATPVVDNRLELHESRQTQSSAWARGDHVPLDQPLPMRFGLVQHRADEAHGWLMEVSDPASENYANWYSQEEVIDMFAPSSETVDAVQQWIESHGISNVSQSTNKQWIQFDVTVDKMEELLATKYHFYEHSVSGHMAIECEEYHLPSYLRQQVDFITPGVTQLGIKVHTKVDENSAEELRLTPSSSSDDTHMPRVLPQTIQNFYQIPPGNKSHKGNELGLYEAGKTYPRQNVLNAFYTQLYPTIPNGTFPIVDFIDGDNQTKSYTTETILDLEVAYPIIWPQNLVIYADPHHVPEAPRHSFLNFFANTFLDAIDGSYCSATGLNPGDKNTSMLQCGVYKPTNVISFSYVGAELTRQTGRKYQARQCLECKTDLKLGMQGISILFGSGDNGAAAPTVEIKCLGPDDYRLWPAFLATCPYVTSVGATRFISDTQSSSISSSPSKYSEVAASAPHLNYTSGGGFSNEFSRPSYQDKAVEAFFRSKNAPAFPYYTNATIGDGIYNRSGRAYPDVSAVGQHIEEAFGFAMGPFGAGTSASTPLFASILTRINEERLSVGKKTVGFVNPVLYANPHVLNDVTSGSNTGCNPKKVAYTAGVGWDPVTGLGSPNYSAMLKLFMGLQ